MNKPSNKQPPSKTTNIQLTAASATSFRGPMPPPEVLEKYNAILPGSAERILHMAESQHNHRIDMESRYVRHEIGRAYAGIACGFLLGALGMLCGAYTILHGHDVAGATIASASLVSLVSVFIYGTQARKAERERRDDANRQSLINQ